MSKVATLLCALLIVVPLVSCSTPPSPAMREHSITTFGEAEVKVVPDTVDLTLGIETQNRDLLTAKSANDEIVQNVLAALAAEGLETRDIQTAYLSIRPDYSSNGQTIVGYVVLKSIGVTLDDVTKFENVLSHALGAGANRVSGIKFQTSELKSLRDQARALAIQAARAKAEAMAKELGQTIGDPISIQEGQLAEWPTFYGPQTSVSSSPSTDITSEGETMALGQISIKARVTIEFSLK